MPQLMISDDRLDGVYETVRDMPGMLTQEALARIGDRLGVAPGYVWHYLYAMRRAGVLCTEPDHQARKGDPRGRSPVRWYVEG